MRMPMTAPATATLDKPSTDTDYLSVRFALPLRTRSGIPLRMESEPSARDTAPGMSREYVKIVRRIFDGWATGDFGWGDADVDDHLILVVPPSFPALGVFVGQDQVREYWRPSFNSGDARPSRPTGHEP